MNVFEAKKIAENAFDNATSNNVVSTGYRYIVVSDKEMDAMLVPDLNTAYQCGCKWIFRARRNCGSTVVELCELH